MNVADPQHASAALNVPLLDCAEEFALLEKGLAPLAGLAAIRPDYLARRLLIEYDPARLDAERVAARIRQIGFAADVAQADGSVQAAIAPAPRRVRRSTLVGGLLLLAAFLAYLAANFDHGLVAALAVASTVVSGLPVARAGWRAVRLRALDMNALMTIAAAGALATGDWFEAATAMFLFGVALWLESFSLDRARQAVRSLVALNPTVAHRFEGDALADADPARLAVGDRVLVRPGERIPVDGTIERGASSVNQAPITGESAPIDKAAGDAVFAGTLNGEGSLEVRATRAATESTLAHIARMVEQAQASRSPTERFVDHFARRYTPAVILLAVLLAVVPQALGILTAAEWASAVPGVEWFHRGLVLLVIACPCALVISTPVTIVCGLRHAARRGVLVKGGAHLESAGGINCIALDKTGTLTTGAAQVVEVVPVEGAEADDVLRMAAMLERHSDHPLAAAIVAAAAARSLDVPEAGDASADGVSAIRGFGIQGELRGETYFVGSPRLFRENGWGGSSAQRDFAAQLSGAAAAATVALVGTRERILGAILLADPPRADAASAIADLKRMGVARIVMITGDSRATAERIAGQLGIDDVRAELLPQDKVDEVARLAQTCPRMAMVGDGVNDAPALAASRLGIALGSQASDTALETADVVIMSPQLMRVVDFLRLGRRTRRILRQNISISLAIKALVLVLAAVGIATMWMAVAADVGASMLVIFNGMRLLNGVEQDEPPQGGTL
jgi:Zn2+/Cd2+-exporting ATPase